MQSHYATSKLIIDPTLPDVAEFRTSQLGDQPSDSVRITQVTSQGGSATINHLRRGTEKVMNIEQVMDTEEEGQLWIVGRIESINVGLKDWYYPIHKGCHKKVEERGEIYYCKSCERCFASDIELKYKVEIVVCDGTGGISLLLWDSHVIMLCGKSAEQIKMEAGQRDEQYPEILDRIMEKVLLFRIHVRSGHLKGTDNLYPVAALCNDDELVAINLPKDFVIDGSDTQMENVTSNEVEVEDGGVSIDLTNDSPTRKEDALLVPKLEDGQHSTNRVSKKGLERGRVLNTDKGN
ncbi:hypothetical protein PIB30_035622 [Stylosanthes scabra]|uniref:Replication factor A C-terminal domain-containing protein n=1 Tax=Stylosanthes scabra TaxID=79078 RepID=A0ABU6YDU9_9FABA|nr:hypothetical protein [Stylosanthes scabra]